MGSFFFCEKKSKPSSHFSEFYRNGNAFVGQSARFGAGQIKLPSTGVRGVNAACNAKKQLRRREKSVVDSRG